MNALLEVLLVALTDAQFDKILVMIGEALLACGAAVRAVWDLLSPLLIGLVAIQLAYYQSKAKEARKVITDKIDKETATSQADRTKIIEDLAENTTINKDALESANNFHAKADKLATKIDKIQLPPMP